MFALILVLIAAWWFAIIFLVFGEAMFVAFCLICGLVMSVDWAYPFRAVYGFFYLLSVFLWYFLLVLLHKRREILG